MSMSIIAQPIPQSLHSLLTSVIIHVHNYRHFFINVNISAKYLFAQLSTLFHKCRGICHGPASIEGFQPILLASVQFRKNYLCPFAAEVALEGGSAEARIQGAA
jgi:hypothetical protein